MFSISIIERALDFGASVPNRAGHADRHAAHVAVGFDFVHAFAGAAPVSKPGESHGAPANGANVVQPVPAVVRQSAGVLYCCQTPELLTAPAPDVDGSQNGYAPVLDFPSSCGTGYGCLQSVFAGLQSDSIQPAGVGRVYPAAGHHAVEPGAYYCPGRGSTVIVGQC